MNLIELLKFNPIFSRACSDCLLFHSIRIKISIKMRVVKTKTLFDKIGIVNNEYEKISDIKLIALNVPKRHCLI